jgi:hypothetical protein
MPVVVLEEQEQKRQPGKRKTAAELPFPEHRFLQEKLYQKDNKSQGDFQKNLGSTLTC